MKKESTHTRFMSECIQNKIQKCNIKIYFETLQSPKIIFSLKISVELSDWIMKIKVNIAKIYKMKIILKKNNYICIYKKKVEIQVNKDEIKKINRQVIQTIKD